MDPRYKPKLYERQILQDGMIDVDCRVRTFATTSEKAVTVLNRRINPQRAAARALAFCGTNPKQF